jgi:hypothetical protein
MFTIRIDDPSDLEIDKPVCDIKGWCSTGSEEGPQNLEFEIGGVPVPYSRLLRPDVDQMYPDWPVAGFLLHLDIGYFIQSVRNLEFVLKVKERSSHAELRFSITLAALNTCLAAASSV